MTRKEKKKIIQELLKSKEIKSLYNEYIIKDISFEEWVENTVYHLTRDLYNEI